MTTCTFCGTFIKADMYRHVARRHLELAQLWRCPMSWCTVWRGTPQDLMDHILNGMNTSSHVLIYDCTFSPHLIGSCFVWACPHHAHHATCIHLLLFQGHQEDNLCRLWCSSHFHCNHDNIRYIHLYIIIYMLLDWEINFLYLVWSQCAGGDQTSHLRNAFPCMRSPCQLNIRAFRMTYYCSVSWDCRWSITIASTDQAGLILCFMESTWRSCALSYR